METVLWWLGDLVHLIANTIPRFMWMPVTDQAVRQTCYPFRRVRVHVLEPGWFLWWPVFMELDQHNVQRDVMALEKEPLTTKDGKTVVAGGVVAFRIVDIERYVLDNVNADEAISEMAQCALRNVVVQADFAELNSKSEIRVDVLTKEGRAELRRFGVEVEYLRITAFAKTECRTLVGDLMASGGYVEEDE